MLIFGLVVAIADGDTLTVLNQDSPQVKVRLAEIDAPERLQPVGTRSRLSLGELCHKKRAEVRVVDLDRYKRVVGRVSCEGGSNAAQVRRGLAWVYDPRPEALDVGSGQIVTLWRHGSGGGDRDNGFLR